MNLNIAGFTDMLNSIVNETPGQNLTESAQAHESEELYFVTEGWSDDDIEYLQENFTADDMYTVLEESIFHGAGSHIIASIVNGGIKRGGEDSAVHVTTASKKGHVYDHLRGADEGDGEKHDSKHTIVKHNGKVIASIHPQGEAGNIKYTANDQHDHAKDENGGQGTHISKGKAYEHIYNAIEKAGGYKGHNVELHSFKTDHERAGKEQSRAAAKTFSNTQSSKSFQGIGSRAAKKLADKHADTGGIDAAASAHNTKMESKMSTIRKHMKSAAASKDYSKVAEHATAMAELAKTHPHHTGNAESFSFKKRANADTLQAHASVKGAAKDSGIASPEITSRHNAHIAKAIKGLKEGEKLKPTDGHQEDMFQSDKLKAQNAGGGYYDADQKRKQLRDAFDSIRANKEKAGKKVEDPWKKKTIAPEVSNHRRPMSDKDATNPQKAAAVIQRANMWRGKK